MLAVRLSKLESKLKLGLLAGLLLSALGSAYAACQVSSGDGCSFNSHTWTFVTENRLPETIQSITPQDAGTQLSYTVKTPDTCHKLGNGGFKIDGISGGTTCKLGVHVKKGKAEGKVNIKLASGSAFNAAYKLPQPPHLKIIPNGATFKPGQHAHFQIKNQGGDMTQPVVIHRPDSLPQSVVQISDNTCQNTKLGEGDKCHVGIGAVSGVKNAYQGHLDVCAGEPCNDANKLGDIKVGVKPQAIGVQGPSFEPFIGQDFQLKVTNQSNASIKPAIDEIPNGVSQVDNSDNTCRGQTLQGGDSCYFVLRGDNRDLKGRSVQIQVKDLNDQVYGSESGSINFKQPQFKVTTEQDQSFYQPGETMTVNVKPIGGSIYKLKATNLQNLTQQSTTCQDDKQSTSCQSIFKVSDEPEVGKQAEVTFSSHYADDSQIQKEIAGFKLSIEDAQNHYTNAPLQLMVTTQSSQKLTGIAPQDLPNGIEKLDSGKDRCQGSLDPSDGSCHIYLQANNQLKNLSHQGKLIKVGADHASTQMQLVTFKPPFKLDLLNKKPSIGEKFELNVTNQSDNQVNNLKVEAPKGIKVLPQGCSEQGSLAPGSSCNFYLQVGDEPVNPNEQKTLTVVSDYGRNTSSPFTIKLPELKASLSPSGQLQMGKILTVTVASKSGNAKLQNIHYTGLKDLEPQGDTKQCDTVDPGSSCVFKFKAKTSGAGGTGKLTLVGEHSQSKQVSVSIADLPQLDVQLDPSSNLHIGKTLKVTIQAKQDDVSLENVTYKDLKNLEVTGDKKQCKLVKPGSSCVLEFKPQYSGAGGQGELTLTSEYAKDQQASVSIAKLPNLQLVEAPFFEEPTVQNIIIENTGTISPIQLTSFTKQQKTPAVGGGVYCYNNNLCDSVTEAEVPYSSQDGDIAPCGQFLQPGQQCQIQLRAPGNSWGTNLFEISGDFNNSPLVVPVNVIDSKVEVHSSDANHYSYLTKLNNDELPTWAGPTTNALKTYTVQIENKGPFDLNLTRKGSMFPTDNYQSLLTDQCSGKSVAKGNQCDIDILADSEGQGGGDNQLSGVLTLFNRNANREPLVALPIVNRACGYEDGGNPYYVADHLIRKIPNIEGTEPTNAKSRKKLEENHLLRVQGIYTANLQNGGKRDYKPLGSSVQANIDQASIASQKSAYVTDEPCWGAGAKGNIHFQSNSSTHYTDFQLQQYIPVSAWTSNSQYIQAYDDATYYKGKCGHDPEKIGERRYPFAVYRKLIIGGDFTHIDGVPNSTAIAAFGRIRGSSDKHNKLHSIATLSAGDSVNAMVMGSQDFYAAGFFDKISTRGYATQVNNIARYDGAIWHALGKGVTNKASSKPAVINTMTRDGNNLYIGGSFDTVGDGDKNSGGLAYWQIDKSLWQPITKNEGGSVRALLITDYNNKKTLWVGGDFKGGIGHVNLSNIDGLNIPSDNNLEPLSDGNHIIVSALAYDTKHHQLIAGGQFKVCDGDSCGYGLAVLDLAKANSSWQPFYAQVDGAPIVTSNLANGRIDSLLYFDAYNVDEASDNALLVGGTFYSGCDPNQCDKDDIQHAIKYDYDSKQWASFFSPPVNGSVQTQIYNNENIYLGGNFSTFGEISDKKMDIAQAGLSRDELPQLEAVGLGSSQAEVEGSEDKILGGSVKSMAFMDSVALSPLQDPLSEPIMGSIHHLHACKGVPKGH